MSGLESFETERWTFYTTLFDPSTRAGSSDNYILERNAVTAEYRTGEIGKMIDEAQGNLDTTSVFFAGFQTPGAQR